MAMHIEDEDRVATEASAQCTFELLMFVLPPGPLGPGVQLKPATLCTKPVPLSIVFHIFRAVCAHTGFAEDLFSDAAGRAVLSTIDPQSGVASGRSVIATPVMSLAAAKLQFFQRLSARIQWANREGAPGGTPAPKTPDVEAAATARAIVVELQKQRAPLALNEFLQDLARAAGSHSRHVEQPVVVDSVQLLPMGDSLAERLGHSTPSAATQAASAQLDILSYPAARSTTVTSASSVTAEANSHESDEEIQPALRRTGGTSTQNSAAGTGLDRFRKVGRKVTIGVRASSTLHEAAKIPVRRSMKEKMQDEDRLKIRSNTNEKTFISDSKSKFKLGVTRIMIGRTLMKGAKIDDLIKNDIFTRFDKDGGGVLDFRELRQALSALGIDESVEQLRARMDVFDTDGDDEIDFKEFSQMVDDITDHQRQESSAAGGSSRNLQNTQLQNLQRNMRATVDTKQIKFADQSREVDAPTHIRRPESTFSMFWDLTQMVLLMYVSFTVTLTIGFDLRDNTPDQWMFWVEVVVDVYFLVDLVLQFFTSHIDSRGIEIVQVKAIAMNYVGFPLQGKVPRWFWLDFASGFPLNYILLAIGNEDAAGQTSNMRSIKIARLAKLLKLLRIARAGRILKRHEETILPLIVIHGLTILLFFSMHSLACFWYMAGLSDNGANCIGTTFAGYVDVEQNDCGRGWVIKRGWRDNVGVDGLPCHAGDSKEDCPMGTVTLSYAYTTSLSDIFMRNVAPETPTEKIYVIIAEIVISMMFGAIAGVIFSQISSMRTTQENYNARLTELKEFASARGLTKPLKLRLLAFHRFLYEGGTVFDEKAILSELPLHMQRDVVYGIYGDLIMKSYFFLGIQHNDSAVMKICCELQSTAALPGDDIYREGDIGDHMFFLLEGEVQQTTELRELDEDTHQSKEEQEDEAAQKPHAQLIIKWEYSGQPGGGDEVVFLNSFLEKGERPGQFNAFREELNTVSGIFVPASRKISQTSYKQTRSEVQAELEQQTGTDKELSVVHSQWTLQFFSDEGSPHDRHSPTSTGRWVLSNEKMRGTLWSDKEQLAWRPPLGTETMWKWEWQDGSSEKSRLIPDKYLPLTCVVMVELISPPLCFGELEMMRIGGGACGCGGAENWCGECGRIRTMTARAMTESRMCRLSAESFATLRAIYPQHMGNNRNFALRKADKKDPQLKLKETRRKRKHTMFQKNDEKNDVYGNLGSGRSQMTSSVESLESFTRNDSRGQSEAAKKAELASLKEGVMREVKAEMQRGQDEIKGMLAQLLAPHGAKLQ